MTPAEIAASIRLTEHGAKQLTCTPRTAAQKLAVACSWDAQATDVSSAELAAVLRRCPSICAQPIALATPDGRRLAALQVTHGRDAIATVQIPARHLEGNPTPRELARLIAGLLA